MSKLFPTPDAAVADIADGVSVMFGGFISASYPSNLIRALGRRGVRGITGIATSVGPGDEIDRLCAAGLVAKMITSFAVRASVAEQSAFERRWRAGEAALELTPQGTLAERIRAGGAGIAAFYTPTGAGTEVAEGKEVRHFGGRAYVLEHALTADVALIKAHRADRFGNLQYRAAGRNFNAPMATAARLVIVEVEELVAAGGIDPERVDTPGVYVDRIVVVPRVPVAMRRRSRSDPQQGR